MALRVVGAGLGRTGTSSLKLALEQLLDGRCYHMVELFERDDDTPVWMDAARGRPVDWAALMDGFVAAVDWPAAAYWRELLAANPSAVVLLSTRESPQRWWRSMERTIVPTLSTPVPPEMIARAARREMTLEMLAARFTPDWSDREAAIAAYERHNDEVRSTVAAGRLVEWRSGDGWEPICGALGLPVPAAEFPHINTSAEFRSSQGLEATDGADSASV